MSKENALQRLCHDTIMYSLMPRAICFNTVLLLSLTHAHNVQDSLQAVMMDINTECSQTAGLY